MVDREMHLDLQVLVKIYEEENIIQALIEVERKDEVFFSTRNMADHIPYGSTNKFLIHPLIGWIETAWESILWEVKCLISAIIFFYD